LQLWLRYAGGSHPEIRFNHPAANQFSYPQDGLIFGFRPADNVQLPISRASPAGTATICAIGEFWFTSINAGSRAAIFILAGAAILRGD